MATYLILNILFMGLVLAIGHWRFRTVWNVRRRWPGLAVLLLLTAIFDNVIIATGIVDYDPGRLLGLYIGRAPIEDFAYSLLAYFVVPVLWNGTSRE